MILIGVLGGVAAAVAQLCKSYFDNSIDKKGKRLPSMKFGYAFIATRNDGYKKLNTLHNP